ncbi:MAG: DUF4193 family protein [Actinomycetota bacterium]
MTPKKDQEAGAEIVAKRKDEELERDEASEEDYEDLEDLDAPEPDEDIELVEDADLEAEAFGIDPDADEAEDESEDEDEEDEYVAGSDAGSDQTSLEELLAQRAARRGSAETEDETDIMALVSGRDTIEERISSRVIPIKDRQEFVCARCRLVKPRVQLADPERGLCRDCV